MRDRDVTWARYLTAARTAAGLSKTELARAAQVGRATVFRWEGGDSRPEQAEIVARVARVLGLDLDEALTAAGLRPGKTPDQPTQTRETDPVIDRIQRSKLTPASKAALLRYVVEQRAARERADLEMLERLIRAQESQGL